MKIKIDSDGFPPTRATEGSAGYDLRASKEVALAAGRREKVHTGVYVSIPAGYEGQIRGRSGLALRGISAHVGTIDSDYRGEICVIMESSTFDLIKRGQRIAQLVVAPVITPELEVVDELPITERGDGGFGSTGE